MRPELREKILAYNREAARRKEKASDLDIILSELFTLPYGQLKKVLTDPVMEVLEKYGIQPDVEQIDEGGENEQKDLY